MSASQHFVILFACERHQFIFNRVDRRQNDHAQRNYENIQIWIVRCRMMSSGKCILSSNSVQDMNFNHWLCWHSDETHRRNKIQIEIIMICRAAEHTIVIFAMMSIVRIGINNIVCGLVCVHECAVRNSLNLKPNRAIILTLQQNNTFFFLFLHLWIHHLIYLISVWVLGWCLVAFTQRD